MPLNSHPIFDLQSCQLCLREWIWSRSLFLIQRMSTQEDMGHLKTNTELIIEWGRCSLDFNPVNELRSGHHTKEKCLGPRRPPWSPWWVESWSGYDVQTHAPEICKLSNRNYKTRLRQLWPDSLASSMSLLKVRWRQNRLSHRAGSQSLPLLGMIYCLHRKPKVDLDDQVKLLQWT